MLNINGKLWFELKNSDVEEFLEKFYGEEDNDENYFFEFKDAAVKNQKIINEVCAFSNTYGGYIFIGVSDNKEIVGCGEWSEERIQNLICDSITPLPNYDVRKFAINSKTIIVIKVDEGSRPPYITNKGEIFERVSSGCRKLVNSDRLSAIYRKSQENQARLDSRLKNENIDVQRKDFPNNIVAVVDMGFEVITNDILDFQKEFYSYNIDNLLNQFREFGITSTCRIGNTLNMAYGNVTHSSGDEELDTMLQAGLNDYMVVYPDGAVKIRCILFSNKDQEVNIDTIIGSFGAFSRAYEYIFSDLLKKFVYASKFEQLHVIKSFRPHLSHDTLCALSEKSQIKDSDWKFENVVYTGGRVPSYGYMQIDKSLFQLNGVEFNADNLFAELFHSSYSFMGMI